jgi:hypothetical protein
LADAQKALTRTLGLAAGLLLASCTSGPQAAWLFKTAREAALPGPVAVWGYPETTADGGRGSIALGPAVRQLFSACAAQSPR